MIVTNWVAKYAVKIASWFTPNVLAVTIYPFIFVYPPEFKNNSYLIKHEKCHLKQWVRYWIIGFIVLYLYQFFIKYNYKTMPLEIEARKAELK